MGKPVLQGLLLVTVLLASVISAPVVSAGDWRFIPRVSTSETWSDNIDLEPSSDAQHDFVTELTPGISVQGRGNRLQLDVDYQAGLLHYARATKSRELQHRLQANGSAEVLEDLFFVDIRSTVSQRNQSSRGVQATDNLSRSDNREKAVTYGITPALRKRFGRFADVELKYEADEVKNTDSLSSSLNSLSLSVSSGKNFAVLPWTVSAYERREDNSTGTENTFRRVNGTVLYAFSRRYSVRILGGYENNDLVGVTDKGDSVDWRVTGIWTPSARTDMQFGYGKRFFGNSFSLQATHKMRRTVFKASYDEDVTTSSFQQSQGELFASEDAFGDPVNNPGTQPVAIATNETSLGDEAVLIKTFTFGVDIKGRRTLGSLNFTNIRRSYAVSTQDEKVSTLIARVSRQLSRNTEANVLARWQRSNFEDTDSKETLTGIELGLSHTIFRDVTARLNYRYQRVSSDIPTDSYNENRLSADISVLF